MYLSFGVCNCRELPLGHLAKKDTGGPDSGMSARAADDDDDHYEFTLFENHSA